MSKFYQALERAEQERRERRQERSAKAVGLDHPPPFSPPFPPSDRSVHSRSGTVLPAREAGMPQSDAIEAHLVSLIAPETFEAEQYRTLSYMIEQLHADANLSVIAVTSPAAGDGKTITAINLASSLTQLPGARVLLVDLDVRRPCVSANLGLERVNSRGLVDFVLDQNMPIEEVLQAYSSSKLTVILTGRAPSTPYDTLQSARLEELITEARQRYDYIVLDTPPLIPFPDCRLIERLADGFLVVVGAHRTPRRLVTEGISIIDREKVVGVVFNNDDQPVLGDHSYYDYDLSHAKGADGRPAGWFKKSFATFFRRAPKD